MDLNLGRKLADQFGYTGKQRAIYRESAVVVANDMLDLKLTEPWIVSRDVV